MAATPVPAIDLGIGSADREKNVDGLKHLPEE